jgi:hypothetical protein
MIFLPSHFNIAQNWLNLLIDDRQWSNITKLKEKKTLLGRYSPAKASHWPPLLTAIGLAISSLLFSIPAPLPSSSSCHFLFLLPLLLFSTKKEEISAAALLEVGFGVQWTFFSALFLCIYTYIVYIFDAFVSVVYRRLIALLVFIRRLV